ncbi:hypothetical protein [Arsenophonus endosymbiont of Bemisia tabaci]|uniref:hypothetical protein n=1 Tax=Arsenophonus endosymbiont of Bemisia tabaci TaxID=536059 RepID=UPI0015F3AE81|nr:hypothetical protein [Arsenophonus endosymbiont of Bemisia tabaci]
MGISQKKLLTPVSPMVRKDSSSLINPEELSRQNPTLSQIALLTKGLWGTAAT